MPEKNTSATRPKKKRQKKTRSGPPSKTTAVVAVRVPIPLLEDLRDLAIDAGKVPAKTQAGKKVDVHYYKATDDRSTAALKAAILEALSNEVAKRIEWNRYVASVEPHRDKLVMTRRSAEAGPYGLAENPEGAS